VKFIVLKKERVVEIILYSIISIVGSFLVLRCYKKASKEIDFFESKNIEEGITDVNN
jgi:hypothetical protein